MEKVDDTQDLEAVSVRHTVGGDTESHRYDTDRPY